MGKRKKEDEVTPEAAPVEADTNKGPLPEDMPEEVSEAADGKDEVTVKFRDHVGQVQSRTFSKMVHGKDFKKLADEFKTTNAARIVA